MTPSSGWVKWTLGPAIPEYVLSHDQRSILNGRDGALAALTADFTAKEIAPNLNDWEDAELIPREVHKALGDAGLLGIGYAEEVGGSGGDSIDVTVLTESLLGAGASGGAFASLFSHGIAIPT